RLPLYRIADVFDRLSYFAPACAESRLNLAAGFLSLAFRPETFVISQVAGRLLGLALRFFGLPLDFVFVPHMVLRRRMLQKTCHCQRRPIFLSYSCSSTSAVCRSKCDAVL